ncbi:MAG: SDR family oxidoreductase [Pseudomonadota bacterium]
MDAHRTLFVTGASGFIGGGLLARLATRNDMRLMAAVREVGVALPKGVAPVLLPVVEPFAGKLPLDAVRVVVHCAARVHVMHDQAGDPLAAFRRVNVEGTLALARQAAAAGVKRFVFISSIKVNGEASEPGRPFTPEDVPAPVDAYGQSKWEAEQGLLALAAQTGMEVVIIRPVLVYGPGVKANFRSMMGWLNKGLPLPLGAIGNRRSLVALDNLLDLIVTCIEHPAAINQVLLVSDDEDLSTTELLRRMGKALGKPARLVPVPAALLRIGAALLGRRAVAQRLCDSLQVDIRKTRALLQWTPPLGVEAALGKTADSFLESLKP